MGKEVFTKVIHKHYGSIAAGITETSSTEYIAPENMHIIGCAFGKTENSSGGQCITSVQRSGQYREVGSYVPEWAMESDDFVFFVWRKMSESGTGIPSQASELQMLPDGSYFWLEKGERIYVHNSTKNNHGSSGYEFAFDVILYYTKTKP